MKYSYSKLDLFNKCHQAYKYKYINEIRAPDTDPLLIGTAVHTVIENYIKGLIREKRQTDFDALEELAKSVVQNLPDKIQEEFGMIVERFRDSFILTNPEIETYVELACAFDKDWKECPWDDENAYYRGKIDFLQIDGEKAIITDWKTNRVIMPQSAIDNSFQLDNYAVFVGKKFPQVKEITVNLFFVRYGATRTSERNHAVASVIQKRIDKTIEKIEGTQAFTAHVASHCEYCEYTNLCTQYQKAIKDLNLDEITNEKEAYTLAKKTFLIEDFLKKAKDKLKAYVDQHGGIEVDDEKLDYWETESTSFPDVQGLTSRLLEEGIDKQQVYSILKCTKTDVSKLLKKKNPELFEEVMAKFAIVKASTRFEFKKIKDE